MKIKELITWLKDFDGEEEIFLSSDSEGNDFKPVSEVVDWTEDELGIIIFPED